MNKLRLHYEGGDVRAFFYSDERCGVWCDITDLYGFCRGGLQRLTKTTKPPQIIEVTRQPQENAIRLLLNDCWVETDDREHITITDYQFDLALELLGITEDNIGEEYYLFVTFYY